jgi:hypothetical protein
MAAEVLRELNRFDEALTILGHVQDARYGMVIEQLRALCEAADPRLIELRLEPLA